MNNITNFLNETNITFSDHNNVSSSETTPTQNMSLLTGACFTASLLGLFYLFFNAQKRLELNRACRNSDFASVVYLLREGTPVNPSSFSKYIMGIPLLEACCQEASLPIIQKLIDSGAKINAQGISGATALMLASNRNVAELLIRNGADINMKDRSGRTALHGAASFERTDVVETLIAGNADVNAKDEYGCSALYFGILSGNKEIIEALFKAGADIHVQTKSGLTLIDVAAISGDLEMIKLLMQKGVVPNMQTILHSAVQSKKIEVVQFIMSSLKPNINAQNDIGNTPLHIYSFDKDFVSIAKYLIAEGADINLRTKQGYTALDIAYEKRNEELINILTSMNAQYSPFCKIPYSAHKALQRVSPIFQHRTIRIGIVRIEIF